MSKSSTERDRTADAVARLERAVEDLVAVAGQRASYHVERATEHLRREAPRHFERRRRAWRREPAWLWSDKPRSRKLHRDKDAGRILGVCAGVARYYGIETWVVRCLAVTALVFFNWVALVSYLVAAFILDVGPTQDEREGHDASASRAAARSPKPEPPASPALQLRAIHADLDEVELRLRRIERHVTSGQYELQRELARIGSTL